MAGVGLPGHPLLRWACLTAIRIPSSRSLSSLKAGASSECLAEEEEADFFSLGEMLATAARFFEEVAMAVRYANLLSGQLGAVSFVQVE